MLKEDTLRLLLEARGPVSGEAVSQALGVSRAAVWKAVEALREEGYVIRSRTGLGYQLSSAPDVLSPTELARSGRTVGSQVVCLDTVDSTNNECRRRAAQGAPDGLVVVAGEQVGGKGRRGRSFQSLPGKGLYLSALLRPDVPPTEVNQLTAWTAVAVCRALEGLTGLPAAIKWVNDVVLEGKKLCGILCEMALDDDGRLDHVVVGIGVNVHQTPEDFGPELSGMATSLAQHMDAPPRRAQVAAALMEELSVLRQGFPHRRGSYLEEYRRRCVTTGQDVVLLRGEERREAYAIDVNDDFTLRVRLPDGSEEDVFSGEVSVRSLKGYT